MNIQFSSVIFKEDNVYIACCPQLDVSSCGDTSEEAVRMLKEAVCLFLEETEKMGTLKSILSEAGFHWDKDNIYTLSEVVATEVVNLDVEGLELTDA